MIDLAEVRALGNITEAKGLTIADVEPVLLSYAFPEDDGPAWSGGQLQGFTAGLVRITTSDGLYGIGETYAGNFAPDVVAALVTYYRSYLVGEDASRIADLWDRCYSRTLYWGRSGIAIATLSGIECALWDLCGKALGRPCVDLLGGAVHDSVACYASGGLDVSIGQLDRELRRYAADGFRAAKIRTGSDPESDFAKASAARTSLGPEAGLAVDAVQGSNPQPWGAQEAIACGKLLEPLGLIWYEEPCAATDIEGYVACRRALDIPIAGGESTTTAEELNRFLTADALDIAQPDASHIGGILEARKAGALAESRSIDLAMHAWGAGVCVMENVHVGFAMPNCRWLEIPVVPNPLIDVLRLEPLEVRDGRIAAPTRPGLGVQLTPEIEAAYPYRPKHHYQFEDRRGVASRWEA
jgi:L-alanine-DL-glutamate epimerase-like enolase superfamily enzyme